MSNPEKKKTIKTSIGGQTVIEGVMMRGPKVTALSVRMPDQSISTEEWATPDGNKWYKKTKIQIVYFLKQSFVRIFWDYPFHRGDCNFNHAVIWFLCCQALCPKTRSRQNAGEQIVVTSGKFNALIR